MPSWQDFQPFIVTGLAFGGIYALSGVGLVVLYRATGVLYLAFGAVGAFGALISWQLIHAAGWNQWLAYLVCVLVAGTLTLAYGFVFGAVLAGRGSLVNTVATLGLTLLLLGVMDLLWTTGGGQARAITLPTDGSGFSIGQVEVTWTQLIALSVGVAITISASAFLRLTKLGTAMRAMAGDREITATLGVPVRRVASVAWFGCGLLAGVAGILLADLVALDATTLTFLVISALAASLIGRLRSIMVTFVAAIAIGLVDALLTPINSLSSYRDITPFVLAAAALLFLNRGRLASVQPGADPMAVSTALPPAPALPPTASQRHIGRRALVRSALTVALIGFVVVVLPSVLSLYYVDALTQSAIYAIVALGLCLLAGRVGLVSLGQVAVLALGAWVAARLLFATSLPFALVLLAAGLATMVLGTLVGLPALRMNGMYLALITLMLAGAITVVLANTNFPNGGSGFLGYGATATVVPAIRRPAIAATDPAFLRYTVIIAVIMFLLVLVHLHTRPGRAWAAIRQSESAALAAGINTTLYKLWAFALASFVTGVAGGLLAGASRYLYSTQFQTQDSITLLAVVLIGGIYTLRGAVIAGLLMQLLPALAQNWGVSDDWLLILFGVGLLQTLITAPGGLADQVPRDLARLGRATYPVVRVGARVGGEPR